MKKSGTDLKRYFSQAFEYWMYLVPDRPRYVILCNFDEFWIYDFDRQLEEPIDMVPLGDLSRRWEAFAFMLPDEKRPVFANDLEAVTRESAARVAQVFNALIERGIEREQAQRFILQTVMAMFAEDIGLLPTHSFTAAIEDARTGSSAFDVVFGLFYQMNTHGQTASGRYQGTPYFNGGLFSEINPFDLVKEEIELIHRACQQDWSQVKPVIFGTLFEQSLDRDERHAFGAHFTSEADIQKVVIPCIVRPWRERISNVRSLADIGRLEAELQSLRVLDPACGSGNFLYTAYRELRRLERDLAEKRLALRRRRSRKEAGTVQRQLAFVSPTQFYGIDIRPFAVEVAKVTLMLGRKLAADELQDEQVVLPLDDLDDNFMTGDSLALQWPKFDVCIGNPPYLGRRLIRRERGADYAAWLEQEFPEVRGVSDYVVYFFRRAHDHLRPGCRAGLVGTNTIRQGDSRKASLDYISDNNGVIFEATADKPWSGDAMVRVSIVNWTKGVDIQPKILWLDEGERQVEVSHISASLSLSTDVATAKQLATNREPKRCFQGQTPGHTSGFVLTHAQARQIVARDTHSAEVIHPFITGDELNSTGVPGRLVIDIPATTLVEAARWQGAFEHVKQHVLPIRQQRAHEEALRNEAALAQNPQARTHRHNQNFLARWWQLAYRRADMLEAIAGLPRYIALSRVAVESKPSLYAFVSPAIWPGDSLQVFAFADEYSFGILQSRYHRLWFEERCSTLRQDLRYTPNTVFDSFPWPQDPTKRQVEAVVSVVVELLDYRESQRRAGTTLGDQYEQLRAPGRSPLRNLHDRLDEAVSVAYGFTTEDPLKELLNLNHQVASKKRAPSHDVRAPGPEGLVSGPRTTNMIESPNIL